jgi:hypothetical protein
MGKKMPPDAQKLLGDDENRVSRCFDDRRVLGIPGRGLLGERKRRTARPWFPEALAVTSAPDAPPTEMFSTDDAPYVAQMRPAAQGNSATVVSTIADLSVRRRG